MTGRTYVINDSDGVEAALMFISQLPLDKKWDVKISPHQNKRSLAQNNLMWIWMGEISAQYKSNGKYHSADDWHYACKTEFLPKRTYSIGSKEYCQVGETKKLKTDEFSEYLLQIESHFLSRGVVLTFPDEYQTAIGRR